MTTQVSPEIVPPKPEPIYIKDDPEPSAEQKPAANGTASAPAIFKKEEHDEAKVDVNLPDAGQGDMFEDVDAPEVVDLTYEGIAEIDGVDHFVCEACLLLTPTQDFKIPQIPKPMIVTRPLKSLFDCIDSGHIILDPDYQREVVWDEGRASLLITSILSKNISPPRGSQQLTDVTIVGYFIPPIIFNVKTRIVNKNGQKEVNYTRICVDGKQRLTSVHKFMKGQIGFFDSNSPQKKWYFCHPYVNDKETFSNHNILPRAVKEFFTKAAFCCYEYDELTLETEETMFQLVQRGIALTPAEKMRAMSTEWANFTKQYEDDYTLIVGLSKQNRASGFRLVLTIFTMIQEVMSGKRKRSSAPTLQASPQALLKVLDDKAPIEDALKLKFKAIFDRYENLVKLSSTQITATRFKINTNSVFDPAPDFLRAPGVEHVRTFSPLELIGTAILVSVHMETRTDLELLDGVKAMRYYLRQNHKDLRVNAQCWVTVWEFVTDEMANLPLPANGQPADEAAAQAGDYTSPYASIAPSGEASGSTAASESGAEVEAASSSVTSAGDSPENPFAEDALSGISAPALAAEDVTAQDKGSRSTAKINGAKSKKTPSKSKPAVTPSSSKAKTCEGKSKSNNSTPSKRSKRAAKPESSPAGVKSEDEAKPKNASSSKRASSTKISPPSKKVKQKV
ncbi:hypothetical protein LSUE1_G002651 [Lachnellula suecica]|uniref:GmrSD restriction endonucleases N-terminal domain-containing protein n=1 Tax=Lachnellula suecica TaxID=602035 RepID=A0A8T9CBK2_9HELO|nr:hypothetical protein LSUE1_G002651 [Lachnellula suecica]